MSGYQAGDNRGDWPADAYSSSYQTFESMAHMTDAYGYTYTMNPRGGYPGEWAAPHQSYLNHVHESNAFGQQQYNQAGAGWMPYYLGRSNPAIYETAYDDVTPQGYGSYMVEEQQGNASITIKARLKVSDTSDQISSVSTSGSISIMRKKRRKVGARFAWTDPLHRDFVIAIFSMGLKSASPEELVHSIRHQTNSKLIATDSVKNVLEMYKDALPSTKTKLATTLDAKTDATGKRKLSDDPGDETSTSHSACASMTRPVKTHIYLDLPNLTENEAMSSLGASLGNLVRLLKSLENKLVVQRRECESAAVKHTITVATPAVSQLSHELTTAVVKFDVCRSANEVAVSKAGQQLPTTIHDGDLPNRFAYPSLAPASRMPDNSRNQMRPEKDAIVDVGLIDGRMDDERMFSYLKSL
ncbi:hypothetical protein MPSEU_000942200 [Mayamaea pseudoterrestris]|nr:hypothetical protein MPSEU_000942200 [Mayamaea pseudoterrestris]